MSYPTLKPNSTWFAPNVSSITRNIITTINIVSSYTPTDISSVIDSWDASVNQDGGIMCYVEGTVLTISVNGSDKISTNEDCSYLFSDINGKDYFKNLTVINGANILDTSSSTTLLRMCYYCSALTYIDCENWNTSNVTDMSYAFGRCSSKNFQPINFSKWDTSNVTKMNGTFYRASYLLPIGFENWDVSNVTTFRETFKYNYVIYEFNLGNWNTSNATDMNHMFANCYQVKYYDFSNFDTTHVTDMTYMFYGANYLEKMKLGEKFSFAGSGTVNLVDVPTPSSSYISGADGNWYTLDGTVYAPADVPNLTANTYYASKMLVIKEQDSKKYISLNSIRIYYDKCNEEFDNKTELIWTEVNELEEITSEDVQALFNTSV